MSSNSAPRVSIIVPAHNAEETIQDALECLVQQTCKDIEVIIVENGSTDNTLAIANEYKKRFPEVITVLVESQGNVGAARNIGIKAARAEYIYSCDADDLVEYRAIEWLYNKAISEDYDIVVAPYWEYIEEKGTYISIANSDQKFLNVDEFIISQLVGFWNMLIKKDLIIQSGLLPACYYEDVAYLPVLASNAKRIGAIDRAVYHYFRREGSTTSTALSPKHRDTIKAEKFAIDNCKSEYREAVVMFVAGRILFNTKTRWFMLDKLVPHLKELWQDIQSNEHIKKDATTLELLQEYAELPDSPIPCIAYVNGFGEGADKELLESARKLAFIELEEIVVLDEHNCNTEECIVVSSAYASGNWEFVGHYFALKRIFDFGGIYLDRRIEIHAPFNYMRYWNAFFGFIDENCFSDWVFGGRAGSKVLKHILDTYEDEERYCNRFTPLSERIRNILVAVYNVQECKTSTFEYRDGLAVFSPEVLATQVTRLEGFMPALHLCAHNYSGYANEEEYVVIKRDTLSWLSQSFRPHSIEDQNWWKERVIELESSRSWRVTQPLRWLMQTKLLRATRLAYNKLRRRS